MGDEVLINSLEQLLPYANKKGILEIAIRGQSKRFAEFPKVVLDIAKEKESQGIAKAANVGKILANSNPIGDAFGIANIKSITAVGNKTLKALSSLTAMQGAGLVLNGLNLCATCAGFMIINKRLEGISGKIGELYNTFKKSQRADASSEFKKILSEHSNMLDARKIKKNYSEATMRELVDGEYNVLCKLIDMFMDDLTSSSEELITSIFSLSAMLTVSLKYYDEDYYFNNKDNITNGEIWHGSHERWVSVFDTITSNEFFEKIQDFGIFDLGLSTYMNDIYCGELYSQIEDCKSEIADNQSLIMEFDSRDILCNFRELDAKIIQSEIEKAIDESGLELTERDKSEIFKKMAIA